MDSELLGTIISVSVFSFILGALFIIELVIPYVIKLTIDQVLEEKQNRLSELNNSDMSK